MVFIIYLGYLWMTCEWNQKAVTTYLKSKQLLPFDLQKLWEHTAISAD